MNYRHAFHAGNFADVFKHAVLLVLLDALTAKDKPLCYLETHAGRGRYLLRQTEAPTPAEWRQGVGRVLAMEAIAPPLRRYADAVRAYHLDRSPTAYPGSPLLAARALRTGDRLVLCEAQATEAEALRELFRGVAQVHVHTRDGYAALKALLPPAEHRGLVLIDPPFELQEAEFPVIEAALTTAHARWPYGVYAVWYPIKSTRTIAPFRRHLAAGPFGAVLDVELLVQPANSPLRLNGCGMLIANPPWHVDRALASLLPALREVLAQSAGASHGLCWLRRD